MYVHVTMKVKVTMYVHISRVSCLVSLYYIGHFFAAAPAAASIYTDTKIRNGEYVRGREYIYGR